MHNWNFFVYSLHLVFQLFTMRCTPYPVPHILDPGMEPFSFCMLFLSFLIPLISYSAHTIHIQLAIYNIFFIRSLKPILIVLYHSVSLPLLLLSNLEQIKKKFTNLFPSLSLFFCFCCWNIHFLMKSLCKRIPHIKFEAKQNKKIIIIIV